MVLKHVAIIATMLPTALLAGCGEESGVAQSATIAPASVSATLECENRMRTTGQPLYGIGPNTTPNTQQPAVQAQSYIDGSQVRRDYPDVEVALAQEQARSQIVALVSGGKPVGILRYTRDDRLGWHVDAIEQCSPSR